MVQGTAFVPSLSANCMVFSSTGSLKVTLMAAFGGTPSEFIMPGFVAIICGGVLSATIGPLLPQVAVANSRRRRTLAMAVSFLATLTLENLFYSHDEAVIVVIIFKDIRRKAVRVTVL
jgi:hypothetical protein